MDGITRILPALGEGEPQAAQLLPPLVYDEPCKRASPTLAEEKPRQTLRAPAPVHQAYLRLLARAILRRLDHRKGCAGHGRSPRTTSRLLVAARSWRRREPSRSAGPGL